jgi:hypothetical protein
MGALRDFLDRVQSRTGALVGRPGTGGPAAEQLTLPGLLTVLALGERTRPIDVPTGPEAPGITEEPIRKALEAVAKRRGVPVTPTEVHEVVELLTTGELFGDLRDGLAAAVQLVPRAPSALVEDALRLGDLPQQLAEAIRLDLRDDPAPSARRLLEDLRDGRLDTRRRILTHTLGVLLDRAAPGLLVGTLRTLIAPDNQTFRLAIVVYARLNGVDIDVEDLDAVYEALDPDNPDLGRLLDRGLERIREKTGRGEEALAFLRRLSARA